MDIEKEKQLVENAKKGLEAFTELYDYYFPKIYSYILKRTQNKEEAEDITSDTFRKALESVKNFKWRGLSFGSWLYKIANNSLTDHWRKSKKVFIKNIDELENSLGQEDKNLEGLDNKINSLNLKQLLKTIPIEYQDAISLKFYEDLSNQEIAKILNISENNLAVRIYRGIKMLKKLTQHKINLNNGGQI